MQNKSWLEVSVVVDSELAEPVSEVFSRFIPDGVAIESTNVLQDDLHIKGKAIGDLRVVGYIPIDEDTEIIQQKLSEALWYLGRILPLPEPEFQTIKSQNWAEEWKKHFKPIPIGKKLLILPPWLENPQPERIPIYIDPGMAFGTGTHPTTQLCLEFLEKLIARWESSPKRPETKTLIDIGCGSGILSIAAIKLGFQKALGMDIDAEAINIARTNAQKNGVASSISVFTGSVEDVLSGKCGLQQAPLVIANILAPIIIDLLATGLAETVSQKGYLLLSGILENQSKDIKNALIQANLKILEQRRRGDWVALLVARPETGPQPG